MLYNLLDHPKNNTIQKQVCIIGGGAAGITLALSFMQTNISVVLLEGGGLGFPSAKELDLYDAKVGAKSYPVGASRLRYLGGSTNHWGGWSRALDDFDFSEKPYFDCKGWPIDVSELRDYYRRAAGVCEIPNFSRSHDGYYSEQLKDGVLDWKNGPFTNKFFVFSPPTRFGKKYLNDLQGSENVDTYLHANATKLIIDNNQIKGVIAKSLEGHELVIEAEQTIVAMGGLENPRFLLQNSSTNFSQGVGNHSDWLGRCFMDHPGFQPINLLLPKGMKYKRHLFEEHPVMPVISMSDEALLEYEMNNFCILLSEIKEDDTINKQYSNNAWLRKASPMGNYNAQVIFEPSPNRESRVTLSSEKDMLGIPKLHLDWKFNDRDFRSVEKAVGLLIKTLGTEGLGRIKWKKQFTPQTIQNINGGMHHAGTTRMSADPVDGVVDPDCAVHGTEGLYVVGNSVFPHVGFSNPTVTIVALALRLSDKIKGIYNG